MPSALGSPAGYLWCHLMAWQWQTCWTWWPQWWFQSLPAELHSSNSRAMKHSPAGAVLMQCIVTLQQLEWDCAAWPQSNRAATAHNGHSTALGHKLMWHPLQIWNMGPVHGSGLARWLAPCHPSSLQDKMSLTPPSVFDTAPHGKLLIK